MIVLNNRGEKALIHTRSTPVYRDSRLTAYQRFILIEICVRLSEEQTCLDKETDTHSTL